MWTFNMGRNLNIVQFSPESFAEDFALAVADYLQKALANPNGNLSQLQGRGPIHEFETRLAEVAGKRFCLATNNATNGLLLLALAAGLTRQEIITTPKSYGATWGPFLLLRNRLRYGKTDDNGNLSPLSVQRLITPRTKAVLAVDYNGFPHDSKAMRELCDRHGLLYLADSAQSFGQSLPDGHAASHFAHAYVLSFGPGKPLFCGEGGAILTDDLALYRNCVRIGQHPERYRLEFSLLDFSDVQPLNARIHPLAAILGLLQLQQFKRSNRETDHLCA